MKETKKVTDQEREQFFFFWSTQREAIAGRISEKTLEWYDIYTARENVGYERGQLRPGKNGQWDLYFWLTDGEIGCDENEAFIASGLTAVEVADEKLRDYYRQNGVDPENPRDVASFERQKGMTPDELDAEIARLETQLAGIDQLTEHA